MTILFLHGWHSVPDGVKPTYLAQHGHDPVAEAPGKTQILIQPDRQ